MSKKSDTNVITEARELMTRYVELSAKNPKVRNDPVCKALLAGVSPKTTEFQTASLAVSTLRNAGCLEASTGAEDPKPTPAKGKGTAKEQSAKEKGKKPEKKGDSPKLRGFARSVDVLLEDAVYRGDYPDKESHPIAQKLRVLRQDPLKEVVVKTLKAKYIEGTLANGKTYRRMTGLDVTKNAKSVTVNVRDEDEVRAVKDIADFDLIATLDPKFLSVVMDERNKFLFSWADKASYTVPEEPEKVWPSLKGTTTLGLIKGGDVTQASLSKALAAENFSRYGPSPTVYYEGKPVVLPQEA
jgi:hypothetical protein